MKNDVIVRTAGKHPAGKIRIAGTVAGIDACELIADCDMLVIGSAIDCDLVVPDPLIPHRAFKLIREKCHYVTAQTCRCFWMLNSFPQARVYVNDHLIRREKLAFGDTISIGCHQFVFSKADAARNRRANINVGDVCARLLTEYTVPPGFLSSSPFRQYLRRMRKALISVAILALAIVLVLILTPREELYVPIQEPLEVVMIAERPVMPTPDAVRSLEDVDRQTVKTPAPLDTKTDLTRPHTTKVEELTMSPLIPDSGRQSPPPVPPELGKVMVDAGSLSPASVADAARVEVDVKPDLAKLSGSAPMRRLSVREAAQARQQSKLRRYQVSLNGGLLRAMFARPVSQNLTGHLQTPSQKSLAADRARQLEMLAAYKPSPVSFEDYQGMQVLVARIAEQLEQLQATASGEIKVDGVVTDAEMAMNWKSGRFRVHAPGNPPPEANPATYCYVGRTEAPGKPCLYIAFICMDPNVDKIIANTQGNGQLDNLLFDDSIEVYLDTNFDRHDYYQMIINSKGYYWSAYLPQPLRSPKFRGYGTWDPSPTIKTRTNKASGQWFCEILIPFDRLDGVPSKGARWAVSFCRNFRGQKADWQLQTWFAVYDKKRDFHHPKLFGVFQW